MRVFSMSDFLEHFLCDEMCVCIVHMYKEVVECQVLHARLFIDPVSDLAARQRLRSASRHQLVVPRFRRSTYGRWAFSVAGPSVWNSLPVEFREPDISIGSFRRSLKTWLFSVY